MVMAMDCAMQHHDVVIDVLIAFSLRSCFVAIDKHRAAMRRSNRDGASPFTAKE
jgi:hypothetical protein